MQYSPAIQLAEAQRWLGYHEYGNNCQRFSAEQYGVLCPTGGWCVSFASHCLIVGGFEFSGDAQFGAKGFAGTGLLEAWAEKHFLARSVNGYFAHPGDLVCVRGAVHTATVVLDRGFDVEARGIPRFITIDGNTSNQVAYRERYSSTLELIVATTIQATAQTTLKETLASQPPVQMEDDDVILVRKNDRGECVTAKVLNGVLFVTGTDTNPFQEGKQGKMTPWDKSHNTWACDLTGGDHFMPPNTHLEGFSARDEHGKAPQPGTWIICSNEPVGASRVVREKVLHRR